MKTQKQYMKTRPVRIPKRSMWVVEARWWPLGFAPYRVGFRDWDDADAMSRELEKSSPREVGSSRVVLYVPAKP